MIDLTFKEYESFSKVDKGMLNCELDILDSEMRLLGERWGNEVHKLNLLRNLLDLEPSEENFKMFKEHCIKTRDLCDKFIHVREISKARKIKEKLSEVEIDDEKEMYIQAGIYVKVPKGISLGAISEDEVYKLSPELRLIKEIVDIQVYSSEIQEN